MFNQSASVAKIKKNVMDIFETRFPIELDGDYKIDISNVRFEEPNADLKMQSDLYLTDGTLTMPVKVDLTVTKAGKELLNRKNITFARVPYPTERGSYIIKGNENVIINQMLLRPGVFIKPPKTTKSDGLLYSAEVRSGRNRFEIVYNANTHTLRMVGLSLQYGFAPNSIDVIPFLRLLAVSDQEIKNAIGNDEIFETIKANSKTSEKGTFQKLFSSEYENAEQAKVQLEENMEKRLTFDKRGKQVSEAMIGKSNDTFNKDMLVSTLTQLFKEVKEPGTAPNIDDIRFKNIFGPEDSISRSIDEGINDWQKKIIAAIKLKKDIKPGIFVPSVNVDKKINELYNSKLVEHINSGNALDLYQNQRKITFAGLSSGTGVGIGIESLTNAARSLDDSSFGKIDPVETPQSLNLGYSQHLSKDVKIENNTLYSAFYKVNNGNIDRSKIVQDIDPMDEYDMYIAFNDPRQLDKTGAKWKLKGDKIRVRYKGKFIEVEPSKVQYIDKSPTSHLGNAVSLVPFVAHDDGMRVMMGASMQRQALQLKDPDEPLVQSIDDEDSGKTIESRLAEEAAYLLKSPVNGKVKEVKDDAIVITDSAGKDVTVKKMYYHPISKSGGYIHHKPTVNVGDEVREGQLIADGWQSKNGKMALGKNSIVAFMPYEGYNFEDGIVISEGYSKKMASEDLTTVEHEVSYEAPYLPKGESKKKLKDLMVSSALLSKLDNDGVIKKGTEIEKGDILIASVYEKKEEDLSKAEKILSRSIIKSIKDQYKDDSIRVTGYQKGKVVDVKKVDTGNGMRVFIRIVAEKPLNIGDKLTGRHGNKGSITKILSDEEMPRTEDGTVVEVIYSPLAVPSRKNLGQLLEVNAGLIAQKKGLSNYQIKNFDETTKTKIMKELEEIGIPDGKVKLIDPRTGKAFENPVTVGPMHMLKLKHKVEGKISGRNFIGDIDPITDMPKKRAGAIDGDRHSPQSIGGMEFWSLTSAGAVNNIHEMTTLKSDGVGSNNDGSNRFKIFEAIKTGRALPEPATPQTLKALQDQLYGAAVAIVPLKGNEEVTLDEKFNSLMLSPMREKDLELLKPKSVQNSKTFNAISKQRDKKGLYSEEVFGEDGSKWGKIDTVTPLANPLYIGVGNSGPRFKPYEAMLRTKGITQVDVTRLVKEGNYIVIDPKNSGFKKYEILTPEEVEIAKFADEKEFDVETGSTALYNLLKDVDLKSELKSAEEEFAALNNSDKKRDLTARDKVIKDIKVLGSAIDRGMKPTDYMMSYVPVLPVKYREPVQTGNNSLAEDGITLLYQRLMKRNEELNRNIKRNAESDAEIDYDVRAGMEKGLFNDLSYIVGTEKYVDKARNIEYKGIMPRLSGKEGFIRDKMQAKRQDYSGRSVIIGAPDLSMDEVRLPEDMAAEIFKPKIEKELSNMGLSIDKMEEALATRNDYFRRALTKAIEGETVVLNRQPSLHRHSIQAFYPKIGWNDDKKKNLAIGLNPLVTGGFNADFDGDTMAVHLPITEAAKEEAKNKLMPSQNLLNPTSNSIVMKLSMEMTLGVYYLTRDRAPENGFKEFKDVKALRKAYEKGEINTYDGVRVPLGRKGVVTTTAGKAIFNSVLPPEYIDLEKNINMRNKQLDAIFLKIMENPKYGSFKVVEILNDLKTIGFKSATKSGLSIGIKDFEAVENIDTDALFAEAEKHPNIAPLINNREEFEVQKSEYVDGVIKKMIEKDKVLGNDNPIEIFRDSGAKGSAGQIRAMGSFFGHGKKVDESPITPIKSSLAGGMRPDEFWEMSNDSRKGIYDRSVATRDPGALTRELWMSNKQTMIVEKDCRDRKGITLNMSIPYENKGLYGRVLLKDVPLKDGKGVIRASKKPLTRQEVELIRTSAQNPSNIVVRSPLSCKSKDGLCQECYGLKPGSTTNELVSIGEAVGSIAAQAIGEPSQQAIMKTFHVGSGQNSVGSGFTMIRDALMQNENTKGQEFAIVSENSGTVTKVIDNGLMGIDIYIDSKKYQLKGKKKHPDIIQGAKVEAGDMLTDPATTILRSADVLKYKGVDAAKAYLTSQLTTAFEAGGTDHIDRRHAELVAGNIAGRAVITNPGSSTFSIGDRVSVNQLNAINKSKELDVPMSYSNRINVIGSKAARDYTTMGGTKIVGKGETITEQAWEKLREGGRRKFVKVIPNKIEFDPTLQSVKSGTKNTNNNWLESAAHNDVKRTITNFSTINAVDQLDNPLTRQMTGLKGNFGEGFDEWKKEMNDKFSNKLI